MQASPLHCDPGMELMPKNENHSMSYLIIFSYGRDMKLVNKTKIFQIRVMSPELRFFLSWPMTPSFVYITIFGLMFVASVKTSKLKLLYNLNEKADFQKLFYFLQTHNYLLFVKMQVKSLKSQAKMDFSSKLGTAFLGSKIVENIRILSFIVKTKI